VLLNKNMMLFITDAYVYSFSINFYMECKNTFTILNFLHKLYWWYIFSNFIYVILVNRAMSKIEISKTHGEMFQFHQLLYKFSFIPAIMRIRLPWISIYSVHWLPRLRMPQKCTLNPHCGPIQW